MRDHPDIETLPLEINGTPDTLSKAGCLALALKSNVLCVTSDLVLRNIFKLK